MVILILLSALSQGKRRNESLKVQGLDVDSRRVLSRPPRLKFEGPARVAFYHHSTAGVDSWPSLRASGVRSVDSCRGIQYVEWLLLRVWTENYKNHKNAHTGGTNSVIYPERESMRTHVQCGPVVGTRVPASQQACV